MKLVAVDCRHCERESRVPISSVWLDTSNGLDRDGTHGTLLWGCEYCRRVSWVRVRGEALAALTDSGAPIVAARRQESPADRLTHDDLLALHEALERADWFDRLRGLVD